ncbi:MAG: putative Leucine-rich repeat domain protein [Promethearchaeota archaeon]|nr:MAG: putative Leucine-rich repeat domain protein [Candidatus Lokiarchaeota archaeon]
MMKSFPINQYLTLKLENGSTFIYVDNKKFTQCFYLLLEIHKDQLSSLEEANSIDEVAEYLDHSMEPLVKKEQPNIAPEVEFWGHCSNLQAWVENDYDPRFLHSNLSFPLLKELTELGDPKAKKVFKEVIAQRFQEGALNTRVYLLKQGYIEQTLFTKDELGLLFEELDLKEFLNLEVKEGLSLLLKILSFGITYSREILHNEIINLFDKYPKFLIEKSLLTLLTPHEIEKFFSRIDTSEFRWLQMDLTYFDSFPDYLLRFSNLETLSYGGVRKGKFPEELCKLTTLRRLEYSYNNLRELPEDIGNLTHLRELNLSGNKLTELPKSIGKLIQLEKLHLDYNNFKVFPEPITELQNLKELEIYNNEIKSIPESIENMTNLRRLFISENNLAMLPESIGNLKKLKDLDLSYNKLESIPESLGDLRNLQDLDLCNNKLKKLPESIKNLSKLEYLLLMENNLIKIPESMGNLTKLKFLTLRNNNITTLPDSIKNLLNLEQIHLYDNPLNPYEYYLRYDLPISEHIMKNKEYYIERLKKENPSTYVSLTKNEKLHP